MKVYAMNISSINPDDKKWYKYLSQKRIEKVERIKKSIQKSQSVGAELLLNYTVNGDIKKCVEWELDANGKMYLKEDTGVYVNLSHSGDYAVCAVHTKHVGVDIQQCRKCDNKLAERFFTPSETTAINCGDVSFFEIWTKKESLVKAVGRGLAIPLNSFSVLEDIVEYEGKTYRFKEYKLKNDNYKLFSCFLD